MNEPSKIIYEVTEDTLTRVINTTLDSLNEQKIYNRFEGVLINSSAVCQILGISTVTMHKYIKAGALLPEPRVGSQDLRFRLSEILKIDLLELRRKLRYNLNNP